MEAITDAVVLYFINIWFMFIQCKSQNFNHLSTSGLCYQATGIDVEKHRRESSQTTLYYMKTFGSFLCYMWFVLRRTKTRLKSKIDFGGGGGGRDWLILFLCCIG